MKRRKTGDAKDARDEMCLVVESIVRPLVAYWGSVLVVCLPCMMMMVK